MNRLALVLFAAGLLCSAIQITGQIETQSGVSGIVTDAAESAPIPRAIVFIHSGQNRIFSVKVDSHGKFKVLLSPGYYDIFVAAPGFAPSCKGFKLAPRETKHVDPKLSPSLDTMEEHTR